MSQVLHVSATQYSNDRNQLLESVKEGTVVVIGKHHKNVAVMLSVEQYQELKTAFEIVMRNKKRAAEKKLINSLMRP